MSRRFAGLVWACIPDLKRKVEVNGLKSLPALQALRAWLLRHGRHLRKLRMLVHRMEQAPEQDVSTVAAAVVACLEAAGEAGGLEKLTAISSIGLPGNEWLATLSSLRKLKLNIEGSVSPAINGLTRLHSLQLVGFPLDLQPGVRLPPSITQLEIHDYGGYSPPWQASAQRKRAAQVRSATRTPPCSMQTALPMADRRCMHRAAASRMACCRCADHEAAAPGEPLIPLVRL